MGVVSVGSHWRRSADCPVWHGWQNACDLASGRDLLYAGGAELDADVALAAASEGRLDALKRLLSWGVDPDAADPYGMTLVSIAALHGNASGVFFSEW